ncbi:branched-chain amino acid ABC transporter permease [Jatrophihabitans cynanchi]|uniref:Branched-chain amino acid ABC transporter permease n=1 Tax=Jatrophihabitans cynanchi TaxID=2944128 RepID=A0ABY7K0P8_9ACTN|nr:branched-chain amino acid ABC transporter permease [Jatrophihabitans sp. SB3-54]WAX58392.1 branched-chain amino acid ABC transporter permease [Jatrophihabitans sp. SB3-54]
MLALVTALMTSTQSSYNLFIYNTALLACIGAIALNLLMGTAGLVSIGNAAFLATGGYSAVFFLRSSVPFPFDLLLAGVVAAVLGLIVGLPALRLRGLSLALATLAGFFIVVYLATQYQSKARGAGSAGFNFAPLFQSKGFDGKERYWAWLLWAVVSGIVVLVWLLTRGKAGRAWRLLREHEGVAATVGVPVTTYKLTAFVISSFFIGVQGGLAAHYDGTVTIENYTLLLSIQFVAMILIGGLDSILGAVIGAGLVTWLPYLVPKITRVFMNESSAALKGPQISTIVYGLLIIIFITRSPDGIVGWFRALRVSPLWRRGRRRESPADGALIESPPAVVLASDARNEHSGA